MSSLRRGFAWSLLSQMGPPIFGFASGPLLAHGLGLAGRGAVAAATAPLLLFSSALTFGLPEALTFAAARGHRIRRAVAISFLVMGGLGASGASIAALASEALAPDDPLVAGLIAQVSWLLIPALLVLALRGVALGRQYWALITIERTLSSGGRFAGLLGLVMADQMSVVTASWVIAAAASLGVLAYAPLLWRTQAPRDAEIYASRSLLSFGARVWLGSLAGVLLSRIDQLMIAPLSSLEELGLYASAVNFGDVLLVVIAAASTVIYSAEAAAGSDERVGRASRLTVLACALGFAALAALSPLLVPWLFGAEFRGAILPSILLLGAIAAGAPGSIAGAALSARGRPGVRSVALAVGLAANVVLILVLVPLYGAVGAALATLIGNSVAGGINIVVLARISSLRISDQILPNLSEAAEVIRDVLARSGRRDEGKGDGHDSQ